MASQESKTSAAQPGTRNDPFISYNFRLDLGTAADAGGGNGETLFYQCSGIGVKVEAIKWRNGGNSQIVYRLPGRTEYADIRLSYGVTKSDAMWTWFKSAIGGAVDRKNCSIIMLGTDGVTEVARWNLTQAWISEFRGAPLNAMSNEVAVEELVLVCETVTPG